MTEIKQLDELGDELIARFADGDGVLWIGAGPSMPRVDAHGRLGHGVPGVAALRDEILAGLPPPIPDPLPDLIEAASQLVVHHDSREPLNEILREFYADPDPDLPEFYRLLPTLPPTAMKIVVNTNFDPYTERSLSLRAPHLVIGERGLGEAWGDRPVVVRAHGDARDPNRCVITGRDYDRWAQDHPLLKRFLTTEVFARRTVVMVGYSGADAHMRSLFSWVRDRVLNAGGPARLLYFVLPNPDRSRFAIFAEHGIPVVLIPTSGEEFLKWLGPRVDKELHRRAAEELERAVDPPDLPALRQEVRAAEEEANWRAFAERAIRVSDRLRELGRTWDSLGWRNRASDAYQRAGDPDAAARTVAERTEIALFERRHAFAAVSYLPRGTQDAFIRDAEPTTLLRLYRAAGLAYAAYGDDKAADQMADRLESLQIGDDAAGVEQDTAAHWIRAGAALCRDDFRSATEHWGAAAERAADPVLAGECAVRALLAKGLAGRYDEAIRGLRGLHVPEGIEPLRQRALGWVLILRGDTIDAVAAFRQAAHTSLRGGDTQRAALALRGETWADGRGTDLLLREEPGFASAERLERLARGPNVDTESVRSLIRYTNADLVNGKLRSAVIHAQQAYMLALDEVDPLGLEWARGALAAAWLRVAELEPGEHEMSSAALFLAHSGPETGAGRPPKPLETFAELAETHATPEAVRRIVTDLTRPGWGMYERTGSLRVLAAIADLIPDELLGPVVGILVEGLQRGWSANTLCNAPEAACVLIERICARLPETDAAEVRDALLRLFDATPPNHRHARDVYLALAEVVHHAPLPPDEGRRIAERLLTEWRKAAPTADTDILVACISSLARRAGPELRNELVRALAEHVERDRALITFELARTGGQMRASDADAFLTSQQRILERLLGQIGTNVHSGPANPRDPIVRLAAPAATGAIRDDVLALALRFLEEDRLARLVRFGWIPFAAFLAAESDRFRGATVIVLERIAHGEFPEEGDELLSDHPLAGMRLVGGANFDETRAVALSALGYLYSSADKGLRKRIEAALRGASADRSATVRAAAVRHCGWVLEALWNEQSNGVESVAKDILSAATDPDPAVRRAAWEVVEAHPEAYAAVNNQTGILTELMQLALATETVASVIRAIEKAERKVAQSAAQ